MDIEKLIAYIESKIYENHKQELTAEMVKDAVVMTAREIGVTHEDVMAVIREKSDDLSETLKLYLTRADAKELLDKKLDVELYESDKEVSNKEKQELDIKLTQTKQELDSVKNSLSHMGNGVVGEAKGSDIISLPNNAMKSVAPNYRFEGLTVQNIVENGDFSEGMNNWSTEKCSLDKFDDSGKISLKVEKAESGVAIRYKHTSLTFPQSDDLLYTKFYYNIPYKCNVRLYWRGSYLDVSKENSVIGGDFLSTIKKGVDSDTFTLNINASEDYKIGDKFEFGVVQIINLTQMFGAGNEPSKEWCDANLPDYVEGTKSVQLPMRVKSVGEKLIYNGNGEFGLNRWLPHLKATELKVLNNGGFSFKRTSLGALDGMKTKLYLEKGIYWVRISNLYHSENSSLQIHLGVSNSDIKPDRIGIVDHKSTAIFSFEVKKSNYYDIIVVNPVSNSTQHFGEFSVSSKKTDEYLAGVESNLYLNNNLELKSVGTVKDYIENGKLYKNIGVSPLLNKNNIGERYDNDNLKNTYSFHLIFDNSLAKKDLASGMAIFNDGEFFETNLYSAIDKKGIYVGSKYTPKLAALREDVDKYEGSSVKEKFLNYIGDRTFKVYYELEEIEVIDLSTSGNITTHPNGTVFIEPVTNVTAYYKDGLDVSLINIVEIEEFSHMVDGVYQNLDVSKVKVEGGKLTHPDAQNGIVYLVYRYDNNSVWGENTISYYNSDKTLKSPNGKIWKKVESATDTGELVVTLEEVNVVEP